MRDSPLRIHVGGSAKNGMGALARRLREASGRFETSEASPASSGELAVELARADVALVVVDAATGLTTEARRECLLASLAGVERVIVALDAMDLAAYGEEVFSRTVAEYRTFAAELVDKDAVVVPMVALAGDNVAERSAKMPWYRGSTLVGLLEGAESSRERLRKKPFRLRIESVVPSGMQGTVESGAVAKGDAVRLASGRTTSVARLVVAGADAERAEAGDALSISFADGSDVRAGDLVSAADRPAEVADQFEATVVWQGEAPLLRGRNYAFEIGGRAVTATIGSLKYRINVASLEHVAAAKLERDEIGVCNLRLDTAVAFDPHRENSSTGRFRLIDPATQVPVGVGVLHFALRRAQNVHWQAIDVNKAARSAQNGQRPCVLWYTGLSGAGKSTIANLVDKKLHASGRHTYLLDGDNVRHGLNKDLGFTAADRVENIRRIAEVAKLMVDAGLIVGTAFISPFRAERDMARALVGANEFIEIFVDTPLGVAEERDPKGLYKKARRGELKNFTGIDSPYEPPENPELRVDTTATTPEAAADLVVEMLKNKGLVDLD